MIIYAGLDINAPEYNQWSDSFSFVHVASAEEAVEKDLLRQAEVYLMGTSAPAITVKEIQSVYAKDKHMSVILLAAPTQIKQVKQAVQFAPYVGKNTQIISLSPELDLGAVFKAAASRTRQKRSFHEINFNTSAKRVPPEKIKLAQMGTLLEYAPIGALLLNDTDIIVNYNQQAKKLFPALEHLGAELSQVFSKERSVQIKEFVHSTHDPEKSLDIPFHQKILEFTCSEVYNEEGQKHYLLLVIDVTDQRQESQRIQTILEALPQMAWTTDPEGKVTYLTQGWFFYTGQPKEEAMDEGWISVIFPDDRDRLVDQWLVSVNTGQPFQQAARYRSIKGEYRWHLARGAAIRNADKQITMWVGTCTDIHDQVLLTEELEKKVKERTRSLEETNNELEQFTHVSSHDLQEPLRKILTFSDLLKSLVYDKVDDQAKRYLDKISSTAERMSGSLKALLNYTRLKSEEKFKTVDLNQVLSMVLVDLELMIGQKGALVEIDPLPTVNAVPLQMQQLFYNLVNNALKFSKKDSTPKIEITARQLMEEELTQYPELPRFKTYYEILVKDNGIGFDQKHADKIFTIFQRLHAKSEFEGTGIGLSLVKKVVSNHKGAIRAFSEPGCGAAFHIILPVNL